mmetsp:Transcript_64287/g.119475  ORF Transcript_64287/g.119475 Transcript_64287/m.119475 type:complete len:521 (-) Transcript_64287:58-1620(-)
MPSTGPRADVSTAGLRRPEQQPEDVSDIEPGDYGVTAVDLDSDLSGGDYASDLAGQDVDDQVVGSSEGGANNAEWRAVLEDSRLVDMSDTGAMSIPKPGSRTVSVHVEGAATDDEVNRRLQEEVQLAAAQGTTDLDSLFHKSALIENGFVDLAADMRHGGPTVPAIMEAMSWGQSKRDPLDNVLDFIGIADAQDVSEWVASSHADHHRSALGEVDRRHEHEDELDVPSDQEVPARAPHSAAPTATMQCREAEPQGATPSGFKAPNILDLGPAVMRGVAGKSISAPPGGAAGHFMRGARTEREAGVPSNEDEEWKSRQRINGVIGRMVRYLAGERPGEDILRLRSSRYGRIVVTAVREGGPASRAGVVAGDELVSIDGWKGFSDCAPHVIHSCFKAPLTLIFVGFVGRLQAEVRVKPLPQPRLGMPRGQRLMGETNHTTASTTSLQLCDAVVFQQDPASLFILTNKETREAQEAASNGNGVSHQEAVRGAVQMPSSTAMYELGQEDAKSLVQKAFGSIATL